MKKMWVVAVAVAVVALAVWGICDVWEVQAESRDDWEAYIEEVCEEYGICPELVEAIIERESSWNPRAENEGCIGLMQIDPLFHYGRMERLGVSNLKDPYDNILVGVDYLDELASRYHSIYAVLMFYNAGYSGKYGLEAWEKGNYSDYAVEIARRAEELERAHGK